MLKEYPPTLVGLFRHRLPLNWAIHTDGSLAISTDTKLITLPRRYWQKFLGIGTKGKQSTTQWKNLLKSEALKLFPNRKITLATADAFLILHYALNNHEKRNSPN
jgi:hypothetical protein